MQGELPDLMGAKEAAEHLGVLSPNLMTTKGIEDCASQQLACGRIFLAADVRRLARRRRRQREQREAKR